MFKSISKILCKTLLPVDEFFSCVNLCLMWSFNIDNYHKCKMLTLLAYSICHLYVSVCLAILNFHFHYSFNFDLHVTINQEVNIRCVIKFK